jgi:hypothetical protein
MKFGRRTVCQVGQVIDSPELRSEGPKADFRILVMRATGGARLGASVRHRKEGNSCRTVVPVFSMDQSCEASKYGVPTGERFRLRFEASGLSSAGFVEFVLAHPVWPSR